MAWKNSLQLEEKYTDAEFQRAFADIYTLRLFLRDCLVQDGYKPPDAFGDAVSLTSSGKQWLPRIQAVVTDISVPQVKLALFVKFFHNDLFIDVSGTNAEAIRKTLDAEILGGRIRYPWVYDRLLYDRFFEMFPVQTEELSYEDTRKLLGDTPNGVFQIRDVLVGPFGVLISSCHRFLPPLRSAALWHCSDLSCEALHNVKLSTGKSKVSEAVGLVSDEARQIHGPASEWAKFFSDFRGAPGYHDDMHLGRLPELLANAFSEVEIRNIFRGLVERRSKEIRERFPKSRRFKSILTGAAEKVSERLSKAECLQLILLMPDETIAECLEWLIHEDNIKIPQSEVRRAVLVVEDGGWFDVTCQCSRFGVRSIPGGLFGQHVGLLRLTRLIKQIYSDPRELKDLGWKLRLSPGETTYEKLDRYLHSEDPKKIAAHLILDTEDHLRRAFELLRYGLLEMPSSAADEEHLVEKILWKLGFPIPLYPEHNRLFWDRLKRFVSVAQRNASHNERDRELIRSEGVNFFVSVEQILACSLAFVTWALLSDHHGNTKFKCNLDEARRFMASSLNGRRLGSNDPLNFDPAGKNNLYELVQGFAVLGELCSQLISCGEEELRRPEQELPFYYQKTELLLFPFLHKALILDLTDGDRSRVIAFLREITHALEVSQVHSVRNGIDHTRTPEEFPDHDKIENVCSALSDVVTKLEQFGICPLVYYNVGELVDRYRRQSTILKNYRGHEIQIRLPSQYRLPYPSALLPQIVVPSMHVGDSAEALRFRLEETSDFVEMWREYPKRRPRVAVDKTEERPNAQQKASEGQLS